MIELPDYGEYKEEVIALGQLLHKRVCDSDDCGCQHEAGMSHSEVFYWQNLAIDILLFIHNRKAYEERELGKIRQGALSKLSPEERKALGL